MKTLKESLLDDVDILLQDTDLFKILIKSMPRKSDFKYPMHGGTIQYYEWTCDLFKSIMGYKTIKLYWNKWYSCLVISLENNKDDRHISTINVYCYDKNDSLIKRRTIAYKILTIFKDNLNILSDYFKDFKDLKGDKIFSDINEFEKSFDKYKK